MYKRIKNYDSMIRLIKEFHPDMVSDTYIHLAKVNLKEILFIVLKNVLKIVSFFNPPSPSLLTTKGATEVNNGRAVPDRLSLSLSLLHFLF